MLSRLKFKIDGLVKEMLDQIPQDILIHGTVLDPAMGGGQFVKEVERRKRAAGLTDEQIKATTFGIERNILCRNYAVNKNKLVGTYDIGNFLEMETGMKFDVIIGNPPYQDSNDTGGALWLNIVNVIFNQLLVDRGIVALVHPPTFIGKQKSANKGKSDYSVFSQNQIDQIHIFDNVGRDTYFPGIGSRICWYIGRKQSPTYPTKIVGYDRKKTYTFSSMLSDTTYLPIVFNELTMGIHAKLIAVDSLKFLSKRELHYHSMKIKDQVAEQKTTTHPYQSYFSHKIIRYANYKFSDFDDIKVMIPQTSTISKAFIAQNCNVSEDLYYVKCKTQDEAEQLISYLNSPLVKYIGQNYRPGRNLGGLLAATIIPDPTAILGLTKDEIDYIETSIK